MEQDPPAASRGQQALGEEPGVLPAARDNPAESGHWWPQEGHRLRREAEGSSPAPLPLAVARAAEQRQRRMPVQGENGQVGSGSPAASVSLPVPSLFRLCLQGAASLISAPSKQYRGSLASLPPGLAQVLLEHLVGEARLHPGSMRLFSGCPLRTLRLDCYPYATNRLLGGLPAFPGLQRLSLFGCSLITDQGLSAVQRLLHLQQLNLSACVKLSDNCLPFLKGLPELSHLALDQTGVTDAGLRGLLLGPPSALSHLSLNRTGVTERTLCLLPHCAPKLCELGLKQTGISDVSALRHSEALRRLFLDDTPVSEASLGTLASHPALGCLTLSGVQSVAGDRALELVSALPLSRLGLPSRHTVTDVGLAAVCRLSGLLELDLTDYIHITDEGLRALPGLGRLRRLSLANTRVTDEGLPHVRPLRLLEELRLDRLPVSSAGVAHCLTGLPHLQVLSLAGTAVGDPVARLGLAECRRLLKLNLSDTRLTDQGLRLLAQLPLVQLNLEGSGVTAAGVAELLAACPTLARVRSGRLRVLSPTDEEEPGH
ncbi:F-box/LRR-repeat protein 14-like [Thamnophis elegans]|uniref:F-box/LRR-repeat protein 14-like n=1 Tax=Thamnophis elegans TaxID=35005 RepID=UPI001376CD61|nr:F-box/LRR-repeat protein 14-like [Thamnophis elegans]XP_032091098.1 F-box/LRR-repeat protein 14-like [Thamnophis elegans]